MEIPYNSLNFSFFLLYFQHDLNLLNICMKPFIHLLISFVLIGKWVADTERVSYLPETRFSTIQVPGQDAGNTKEINDGHSSI